MSDSHVLWDNPSRQLSPTQLLAHYPPGDVGEDWKDKIVKTHGLR